MYTVVLTDSWSQLLAAELNLPLYPTLFVLPDGKLFQAGPKATSRTFDIDAQKWEVVATANFSSLQGSAVLYRPTQILKMGGGEPATTGAEVIDLGDASPAWRTVYLRSPLRG